MDINAFGQRLRALRGEKSQADIVETMIRKAGVTITAQTLGRYERGERKPDLEIIEALATTFDVSADYLLCRTDIKTVNADLANACAYTGLSEQAIEILSNVKNMYLQEDGYSEIISHFIINTDFYRLIRCLNELKDYSEYAYNILSGIFISNPELISLDNDNNEIFSTYDSMNDFDRECDMDRYKAEEVFRDYLNKIDSRKSNPNERGYTWDQMLNILDRKSVEAWRKESKKIYATKEPTKE